MHCRAYARTAPRRMSILASVCLILAGSRCFLVSPRRAKDRLRARSRPYFPMNVPTTRRVCFATFIVWIRLVAVLDQTRLVGFRVHSPTR